MNRIDAGIVGKSLFGQDGERPQAGSGNRPARRSVTVYCNARCIFDHVFGLTRVFAELIRCEAVNRSMPVAVTGKLVSARLYFAHQVRKSFSHPADKEKCSLGIVLVKKVQHTMSI